MKHSAPPSIAEQDPVQLVSRLPSDAEVRLLAGRGHGGWASSPLLPARRPLAGQHLLALGPGVRFCGGREALRSALDWLAPSPARSPWDRVLVGSLAYELAAELGGQAVPAPGSGSSVDLAGFTAVYLYDVTRETARIEGECPAARARLAEQLERARGSRPSRQRVSLGTPRSTLERAVYCSGVQSILDWIRRGDVYQVNLSRALEFPAVSRSAMRAMFEQLSRSGDAPFAALIESPDRVVVSNSPERFLRVASGRIETCPIKGTIARGATPEEDARRARALLHSEKDAAEHVMIVDLERNDLGRVCQTGSVGVTEFARLRSYASVHHLVSSVQGRVAAGVDALQLLEATFPSGSVTGAPKHRAMQIIAALEATARDVYTGAIGYFDASGGLDLSVAIRTAIHRDGVLRVHAGGGIVSESDAKAEWDETEAKLAAFAEHWGFGS